MSLMWQKQNKVSIHSNVEPKLPDADTYWKTAGIFGWGDLPLLAVPWQCQRDSEWEIEKAIRNGPAPKTWSSWVQIYLSLVGSWQSLPYHFDQILILIIRVSGPQTDDSYCNFLLLCPKILSFLSPVFFKSSQSCLLPPLPPPNPLCSHTLAPSPFIYPLV